MEVDLSGVEKGNLTVTAAHLSGDGEQASATKRIAETIAQNVSPLINRVESAKRDCLAGGRGTREDPIVICDYQGLQNIKNDINERGVLDRFYALGADIDASASWREHHLPGESCLPYNGSAIAPSKPCSGWVPLPGLRGGGFDGRDHTIGHLYIHSPLMREGSPRGVGLFSYLDEGSLSKIYTCDLCKLAMGMLREPGELQGVLWPCGSR